MYGYETFHEDLMKNLIESVHNGASSHAYIFEGEKGLGVLNSARLFAAALTCKNTGVAPCGSCQNCVESKADTNPDIIYVRPKACTVLFKIICDNHITIFLFKFLS